MLMQDYRTKMKIKQNKRIQGIVNTQLSSQFSALYKSGELSYEPGSIYDPTVFVRLNGSRFINFEMVGVNKFEITTNTALATDIMKIVQCQSVFDYDVKDNAWILPITCYNDVLQEVRSLVETKKEISVSEISQIAFDLLDYPIPFTSPNIKPIIKYNYQSDITFKPRLGSLPPQLFQKLYNFQKVGIQFGLDHHCRMLLGDEMGVGKTVQAISLSYLYQRDWPVLIIAPSSLKFTWKDEILNWLPEKVKSHHIQVIQKESQDFYSPQYMYYIISYSLAWKMSGLLLKLNFQFVIIDEAHYLKSREAKRSQHLLPVIMRAKRILLLTGTPLLARPSEVYNLLKILRPDVFRSFKEFGFRYCNPRENIFGVDWTGSSNMKELHLLLEKALMIRRLKQEVLFELPAKRRQKIIVQVEDKYQRKIAKHLKSVKKWEQQIEEDFQTLDTLESIVSRQDEDKSSLLLRAYTMTGTAKVKGVISFIETLIDNKAKFILFAHHYDVLDQLEDFVVRKCVSYIRIDGRIDNKKRHEAVKKFQTDPICSVALLSLTASSQGITLTAASTVVFAEMNWTPGIMVQAEDRAHRIGQTSSVMVYYIYGEGTLDRLIYPRLQCKSQVISSIVDGKKKNSFQLDALERIDAANERKRRIPEQVNNDYNDIVNPANSDESDKSDNEAKSKKPQRGKRQVVSGSGDGIPIIPELIQYNDSFEIDPNRRHTKQREKIYECFRKLRLGSQKNAKMQSNINDYFFNQNKDISENDIEMFKQLRFEKIREKQIQQNNPSSQLYSLQSYNPFISTTQTQQNQLNLDLEEQYLEQTADNEILPKPPLFLYDEDVENVPQDDQNEYDQAVEESMRELQERDPQKVFYEIKQKKKRLIRETDPTRYMKLKPPPLPQMRPRIMHHMNRGFRRHNKRWRKKYARWRRHLYEGGKTLVVNEPQQTTIKEATEREEEDNGDEEEQQEPEEEDEETIKMRERFDQINIPANICDEEVPIPKEEVVRQLTPPKPKESDKIVEKMMNEISYLIFRLLQIPRQLKLLKKRSGNLTLSILQKLQNQLWCKRNQYSRILTSNLRIKNQIIILNQKSDSHKMNASLSLLQKHGAINPY
ncbi:hypothetical protein FGO68_gene11858 [Halteria grandinella]|uniref:Uncharacterized protein n=1 Tax=Halteria grandinella TaxID=5974 RepID=A0A8J8P6D0_HALGN|nr:hypothetical protein FGO68_gene11858 [Halteria grandinella]